MLPCTCGDSYHQSLQLMNFEEDLKKRKPSTLLVGM